MTCLIPSHSDYGWNARTSEEPAGDVSAAPPTVSIVIIFLNEERFLAEAVESVLAQHYGDWELLLCDDGSTDGSTEIARTYEARHPGRIRYFDFPGHVNRGKNAARNLGIRHARGTFVAFLDGDDVWLPHKLERQVPLAEQHPDAAMVYGRTMYWSSWTGRAEDAGRDCLTEVGFVLDRVVAPPTPLVRYLEDESVYPCMCSVLVRRTVFDEVGLFEEDYRHGSQDMTFHAKLLLRKPVYVSSECWDRYRIHSGSYWGQMRERGLYVEGRPHVTAHRFQRWLESYLVDHSVTSGPVWEALQDALWRYRHPVLFRLAERLAPLGCFASGLLRVLRARAS